MGSLNHLSVQKALDCTFTAISVCSWEFRLSSVSHSDFPAQNSSSSSASFSLISSCSSRSGTSSSCLKRTALLLNWPVCGQYPGAGAGGTSCKLQDRNTSPRQPGTWQALQPLRLHKHRLTKERTCTRRPHYCKNFILIWLQKKQDEGSAMWSEFKASASWGELSGWH